MSHVVAADHDDEVAIASGASWALAPTPRVGPARKTSCRTCLWSLIALDGLPERASEAKIAFAQLFSLLNFRARRVLDREHTASRALLDPGDSLSPNSVYLRRTRTDWVPIQLTPPEG